MMTDKAEESTVGPEKQMKCHGEPMTSPLCKSRLTRGLLSVMPEGEGAFQARGSAVSLEDDDPKVTRKSVLFGMMPDKLSLNPETMNSDVKHQIMKEIRQFGRKYEKIFKLLEGIQGPPKVRRQFVEFAIKEAARFKRRDLIKHLEKILDKIESDKFLSKDKHSPNI